VTTPGRKGLGERMEPMRSLLAGRRPSPALIVAFLALLAAVTGSAVALPGKRDVDKNDLRKNVVQSWNVKPGSITASDVRAESLTGGQLQGDSVTGADVDESTLAVGFERQFQARLNFGDDVLLFENGPLTARIRCLADFDEPPPGGSPVDKVSIYVETTQPGSFLDGVDKLNGETDSPPDGLQANETLDPGDAPVDTELLTSTEQSNGAGMGSPADNGFAIAADGTYIGIPGESAALGVNVLGSDCVATGAATLRPAF
jgi:hypothetical protein